MERELTVLLAARHHSLYLGNPWFRQGVDLLARFLPVLIDGLAAQAEQKNAEMQEQLNVLEHSAPHRLPGSPGPASLP